MLIFLLFVFYKNINKKVFDLKISPNSLNFKTVSPINYRAFSNLHFGGQINEDKFEKDETYAFDPVSYINGKFQDTEKMAKYLPNVCSALSKNDENSRNIAALIDYAAKNNMPSHFIMDLLTNPKLNPLLVEELKAKDVEIKTFKSKKEAIENSKTGDVFSIADDDFISIKTSDSEITPLKITPETYKKLFPPIKGKVTTQNLSSDCYLLGVLNAMMNNPMGKAKILSMFEERDGNICLNFENGNLEHEFKGGNLPDGADFLRLANAPLGIKMIEYAYGDELEEKNIRCGEEESLSHANSMLPPYYPKYSKLADYLRDENGSVAGFMQIMGLKDIKKCNLIIPNGQSEVTDALYSLDGFEDKIFVAASNQTPTKLNNGTTTKRNHAYVIEPYTENKRIKFRLYNSSNSAFYSDVNLSDILNSFSRIYIGKITN